MKHQRLVPSCSETLAPLYERARREGRVAPPEEAPALLRAAAAAWSSEHPSPPPDLEDVKAVIQDYCVTAGVTQLSAWAEEREGHIDVRILEQRKDVQVAMEEGSSGAME